MVASTPQARVPVMRRLALTWGVVTVVIVGAGITALGVGRAADDADVRVLEALDAGRAIDGVLDHLVELETGQRGYVLTGDRSFLPPYHDALEALPAACRELDQALAREGVRADATQELDALIESRIAIAVRTVELVERGERQRAIDLVRSGEGRRRMDAIRSAIRRLDAEQSRRVERALALASTTRTRAWWGVVIGIALALGVSLFAGVTAGRDLRAVDRATRAVAESERRFRSIAESASDLVRLHSPEGRTLYVSPSIEKLLGWSQSEALAMAPGELVAEPDRERVAEILAGFVARAESPPPFVHRLRHRDGRLRWFETRVDPLLDDEGTVSGFQTLARDVTTRIAEERDLRERTEELARETIELRDRSERDKLTGVFNREGFFTHGEALLRANLASGHACALFFCDLDGLKAINDALGHEVGDAAIAEAAALLLDTARSSDIVGRLGGDELVVLAPGGDDVGASAWRRRVERALAEKNADDTRTYTLALSLGHVVAEPEGGMTLAELLALADQRMYEEKRRRKSERGRAEGIVRGSHA